MRFVVTLALLVCMAPSLVWAQATAEQRAALQTQLDQIETDILRTQTNLAQEQTQRQSLERDVSILNSKIKVAQLGIKQRDLRIAQLKQNISDKEQGISVLDQKVVQGRDSIAQMLRETHAIDDLSLVELALGGSLSDIMQEIDDFGSIQRALGISFDEIAAARNDLTARKAALQEQQQEEQDLLQIQVLENKSLKQAEKDKQTLVSAAKGQEKIYQQVIAQKKQSAAQIRAALFSLRDTKKSVSFGDMYAYAKEASAKTGVRPAVILAILSEETNLGQNLGSGNWRVDMHPTRDAPIFKDICDALGLDPDKQPVSKKPWYGWGGAMGPAQFIPSTWKQYATRIAKMTGQDPANPWEPRTAVFATAILMMDNGADAQTRASERLAALRYLAGWKNASKSAYAFYGNDVMSLADKFQSQIDILGG